MTDELGPEPQELEEKVKEAVEEVREDLAEEKAQQQKDRQWLNLIGLSTGILSGLAAIAAMQAGSLANEGMSAQIRAADQWAFYQAESTKRRVDESTITLLRALQKPVPSEMTKEVNRLQQQQQTLKTEAQKLQIESQQDLHRHEMFARSVTALQVGISLGAVAALLRKRSVWYLGLGIAAVGISFMVVGTLPGEHQQTKERAHTRANLTSRASSRLP